MLAMLLWQCVYMGFKAIHKYHFISIHVCSTHREPQVPFHAQRMALSAGESQLSTEGSKIKQGRLHGFSPLGFITQVQREQARGSTAAYSCLGNSPQLGRYEFFLPVQTAVSVINSEY